MTSANANRQSPAIEIWIPGSWRDEAELHKAGAAHPGVRLLPRNEELARWMKSGSGGVFEPAALATIDAHRSVACITVDDTGKNLAADLQAIGRALRQAGGLGVRVARCGLAHPWDRWEAFLSADDPGGLYRALIVQVADTDRGRLETFGMNQFGLPDASVEIDESDDWEAAWSAFAFNAYLREERPKLKDGHTFQAAENAPVFVLTKETDDRYAVGDPYFNEAGLWCLSPPGSQ